MDGWSRERGRQNEQIVRDGEGRAEQKHKTKFRQTGF